jgi:3-deoxy-D-manno-octulosonic acid kinase
MPRFSVSQGGASLLSDALEIIDQPRVRAIVAPGFLTRLRELNALEPTGWRHHFNGEDRSGAGRLPVATPRLSGGLELVLRRFHHGGLFAGLFNDKLMSPARIFREFRIHHALAERGAPVPRPAFAVAHRSGALWTGGIATVRVAGAVEAGAFLRAHPAGPAVRGAAAAVGDALRRFHDAGGRHADLHIGNILLCESAPAKAVILDLDQARDGAPPSNGRRAKEIGRLHRSLYKRRLRPHPVDPPAIACFWEAYTADAPEGLRDLQRRLHAQALRIAIHRAGYALGPGSRTG